MAAWLFPGQGSQHRGMGAELFDERPDLRGRADDILGYSIAELCREDPQERLADTQFAQPALFVVEALAHLRRAAGGQRPEFLAGHSLGEYAALFAAGCFDFDTGLRLVRRRGEIMARASGGGMLAVLGPRADTAGAVLAAEGCTELDTANLNAADQVVLAGPTAELSRAAGILRKHGFRCVPLRVAAAFHSRHMETAAREFAAELAQVAFRPPRIPVLSNVTGRPYPADGEVAPLLAQQMRSPVRWERGMRHLIDSGVRDIVEVGPGTTLTGLWRSTLRAASCDRTPLPTGPGTPGPSLLARHPAAVVPTRSEPPAGPGPQRLGSAAFREAYGVRYAYLTGSMYHAIASVDLVVRMGRAGLMGFFGAGGLRPERIEEAIEHITRALGPEGRYGMNLLATPGDPALERAVVDLYLGRGVRHVEAAAYTRLTAPLVHYRFAGAHRDRSGAPVAVNRVLAKVSRPEVAEAFLRPPPGALLDALVADGRLTRQEASVAARLPVSEDICVESDSGGHTDGGVALTLLPTMRRLRDTVAGEHPGSPVPRVGAAGGLGSPEALAAVFVLGADFVISGSINQCTPEAGTSDEVKDLLATVGIQDTALAPAGDLFEAGARVQVVRKATLFAARAGRIYQAYRRYGALEEIDAATRRAVEEDCFGGRSFEKVWAETRDHLARHRPADLEAALRDPRRRMALVLRWYFRHSTALALRGDPDGRANYQIHCGPAMGAFNAWVRGTDLEDWRHRHVDAVADRLMTATADHLRDALRRVEDEQTPIASRSAQS
ncbi:ACP S-malonyltransferase [Streptomyces canus]|uniref:[acyl-carrier-protein] S-malonyltransferase n=1 Tax=Streptomyces canus TaxID=58343 RepID=A0AAW8FQV6_9ACTN|nr:ACP S-malonyltransferase [Streptomyces canus]MDQ0912436.1 trans-AT polyketide synthase/acyltransferase/oxidoreductase domain-containing protein [Streptomyces canus]MDQ1072423.1 trans-AT polyketide synthase/acyltransferase/oxidoreductase domain-containing protein [Streptomyces canus]